MKIILLSSFLFLLASCNALKKSASAETEKKSESDTKTVVITYHRTFCFGTCPVFTLTINGETKTATYKGERNVDKIGEFKKEITQLELTNFISAFEKHHFFDLKDSYPSAATDLPSKITTYTIDGKTKKIDDMEKAPAGLKELEKLLEDFANSEGWVKISKEE
jgi:hypothetical protein